MSDLLEQKIVSALSDTEISSSALAALIDEAEAAIALAEQAAETTRAEALDPVVSPDPVKARAAMEDVGFGLARLRTLLPRLRERHAKVAARERAAAWFAECEQVRGEMDAAAEQFARYPEIVAELLALFREAERVDQKVQRINATAPPAVHQRLLGVELTARGLDRFTRDSPSILGRVQLPDVHGTRMLWPPPAAPLGVLVAQSMSFSPGPGADWAEAVEARNSARRDENARVAAFHSAQSAERQERENAAIRRTAAARRRQS